MRKNRFRGLGLLLAAAMIFSLPGCGEEKIEDIEYVGESSTNNSNSSKTTDDQTDQPLAKRLGIDDKMVYKEEFDVQGKKVKIDINQEPQDINRIPSYMAVLVTYDEENEKTIVNNLFGDTAKMIDVDPNDYLRSDENNPVASENDVVHVYEGIYEGHTCRFSYIYTDYNNTISMSMRTVDIAGFVGASGKKYMHSFYSYGGFYAVGSEEEIGENESEEKETDDQDEYMTSEQIRAFSDEMTAMPNRYTASDDELYDIAYRFIKDILGIKVLDESISIDTDDGMFSLEDNEESGEKSPRTELFFTDSNKFGTTTEETGEVIKDGYSVIYTSFIEGMNSTTGRTDYLGNDNYGSINITKEGIISFDYTYSYILDEMLADDVQLLSFNDVMECLKKELSDKLDVKAMKSSQIVYDTGFLMYYGIRSPERGNEYTFIPVWLFSGTIDDMQVSEIMINAVDGSFIMMRVD